MVVVISRLSSSVGPWPSTAGIGRDWRRGHQDRTERASLPTQVDVQTLVTMPAEVHEDDLARFLN
jgi:hypothetical protein